MKFRKEDLVGKHILVGVCYRNSDGDLVKTVQNHGTVVGCEGAVVEYLPSGARDTVRIPYNPSFFEPGEPGASYTLRDTGEEVQDVDVVATFDVRLPQEQSTN